VDSRLNPDGEVTANFKVLGVFERTGQRLIRVQRELGFRAFRPAIGADGLPLKDVESKDVVRVRLNEVTDINLETGIYEAKGTVMQMYFERPKKGAGDVHPAVDSLNGTGAGLMSTTRSRETLTKVVYKDD
jgi:hypothetical protein